MNKIEPLQQNFIFKVNPVNLFENRQKTNSQNKYEAGMFPFLSEGNYNLNHPKAGGNNVLANNLDFLA